MSRETHKHEDDKELEVVREFFKTHSEFFKKHRKAVAKFFAVSTVWMGDKIADNIVADLYQLFKDKVANTEQIRIDQLSAHYKRHHDLESLSQLMPYLRLGMSKLDVEKYLGKGESTDDIMFDYKTQDILMGLKVTYSIWNHPRRTAGFWQNTNKLQTYQFGHVDERWWPDDVLQTSPPYRRR